MSSFEYAAPRSLDEAISLLTKNANARALAGGHRLLVEPERSRLPGHLLVDLGKIPGLAGIMPDGGGLNIGSMTTLAALASDDGVRKSYPALAEAARVTEDAQQRNRATLGGSLALADPEADLPAPVLALEARINIAGARGSRTLAADELITAAYRTALAPGEVIESIALPRLGERTGSAYERFKHPATLRAICGVAASVTLSDAGAITAARVALTGAADRPARLRQVEQALEGRQPADALIAAAQLAGSGLTFRADHFASAEYRRHLARVITERALRRAIERAASLGRKRTLTAGGDQ
jgi:carbon-monoxide dehydrogenase medium subunit